MSSCATCSESYSQPSIPQACDRPTLPRPGTKHPCTLLPGLSDIVRINRYLAAGLHEVDKCMVSTCVAISRLTGLTVDRSRMPFFHLCVAEFCCLYKRCRCDPWTRSSRLLLLSPWLRLYQLQVQHSTTFQILYAFQISSSSDYRDISK